MERQRIKPMLFGLFLTASVSACGAGNPTPSMPGPGSPAFAAIAPSAAAYVRLGNAKPFAILAGTTVTNTGPTEITGDVGIFPGTAITGFPPGVIHGTLHAADSAAQRAELDLTAAYNFAMGQTNKPVAVAGNLGGQTLTPGLYKSTSGLAVSSGDLTLDARGKSSSVFVFQMASTFNMTSGRKIILANGARARNIFWAVGSSATLGTGCTFRGNLLAHKSISFATGSVMIGRALARLGAVTMQRNSIVKPAY